MQTFLTLLPVGVPLLVVAIGYIVQMLPQKQQATYQLLKDRIWDAIKAIEESPTTTRMTGVQKKQLLMTRVTGMNIQTDPYTLESVIESLVAMLPPTHQIRNNTTGPLAAVPKVTMQASSQPPQFTDQTPKASQSGVGAIAKNDAFTIS